MIHCNRTLIGKMSQLLTDRSTEKVAALIGEKVGEDYYVMDVIPAYNEDDDPSNMFFVSNRQIGQLMVDAERRGYFLLGIAHSHLEHHPAEPSQADIRGCQHAVNAVYHPTSRSLTWFNRSGKVYAQTEPPKYLIHAMSPRTLAYAIAD